LLFVSLAALVNYLIDPYAVFGAGTIAGLNQVKPHPDVMLPEIKLILGTRARPDALILGNSRAEVGFDPQHPAFRARGLLAFNAAVPGSATEYEASALQRFAVASNIRVAIIGLDFLDFLYGPNESARPTPAFEGSASAARTRLLALFSVTALLDSARTVVIQHERHPATLRPDGFNPMLDYLDIAATEGYAVLFRQRAEQSARQLAREPHNLYTQGSRQSPAFSALESVLRIAAEKGIDVQLVIYPYHLILMLQIEAAGLWPLFEEWKADVAALSDEARRRGVRVSLWDFACPDHQTAEAVPGDDERKAMMRWYWEAGHFKKELGDLVLARIFGQGNQYGGEGFGIQLTSENAAARNDACRAALATMRNTPGILSSVRAK
jgi:hypothetical protein